MAGFEWPKWNDVFVPDGSLLESFLRATLIYVAVLALFRIAQKRQRGSVGLGDLMLLLLMAEVVSQAVTGEFNSVPNAVVGLATFIGWSYVTDWLCYKFKWAERVLQSSPLQLLRDGRPLKENMKQEHISDDELLSKLREKGYDDFSQVRAAFIEPEGKVSVIPRDREGMDGRGQQQPEEPAADPSHPPEFDAALRHFLEAARRLHQAASWHDEQAAEHRRLAAEARSVLSRHGVRPKALLEADGEQSAETNGRHDGIPGERPA